MDLEGFYRAEFKALVRFVLRAAGSTDAYQAADAVQEAFCKAVPRWAGLHNPRAWLRTTALREFLRCDAPAPTATLTDSVHGEDAHSALDRREQERLVRATLQHLPYCQREALAWTYDGFTPTEIAEHTGQAPGTVRQHLHKARRRLAAGNRTRDAS